MDLAADIKTTITAGFSGSLAGVVSNTLSQFILKTTGGDQGSGAGAVGIRFLVQATVAASTFALVASYMPETTDNVLFSFAFFSSNAGLISSSRTLANSLVSSLSRGLTVAPAYVPGAGIALGTPAASCPTACK